MEYTDLVYVKKQLIESFFSFKENWDDSLDYIPYRYSIESLRDELRGLDYIYEKEYENACHKKPKETMDYAAKILLLQSLLGRNLTESNIAFILGFGIDEVRYMLSKLY